MLNIINVFIIAVQDVWILWLNLVGFVCFIKWSAAVVKIASHSFTPHLYLREEGSVNLLLLFSFWEMRELILIDQLDREERTGFYTGPFHFLGRYNVPLTCCAFKPWTFLLLWIVRNVARELNYDTLALFLLYLTGFPKSILLLGFRSSTESCETLLNSNT